ncbi:MAG: hypothetical protein IKZ74_02340, partial [Clostridiales bacterium]|nr:hypothetical protein [Clostridiales bacterium]
MDRVPYILVVGEKEAANHSVSVRSRDLEQDKQELGEMDVMKFVERIREESEK